MLRFCGSDLELRIDSVLQRRAEQPALCSATDVDGRHWLIVQGSTEQGGGGEDVAWICAPASEKVVKLVEAGQASPIDAVRHSETGWVDVVRLVAGRSVPDWRVPCSSVGHDASVRGPAVSPGL